MPALHPALNTPEYLAMIRGSLVLCSQDLITSPIAGVLCSHGCYEPLSKTLPVGIYDTEKDRVCNLGVSAVTYYIADRLTK
jgi:hypothetical protein